MRGILNFLLYTSIWLVLIVVTVGIALVVLVPIFWLTFANMTRRAEKAKAALDGTLMHDEVLVAFGLQHRVFALWHRRELVAITSSRTIVTRRGLLGGFKMQDIQWKDLRDVTIEENILPSLCGSNLSFAHNNGRVARMYIPGVPSEPARQIYTRGQSEEQAWEEKRRVRAMEEARSVSGGIVVHAGGHGAAPAASGNRLVDEIARAKELLDSGAISDAEFQEMKAKILSAS